MNGGSSLQVTSLKQDLVDPFHSSMSAKYERIERAVRSNDIRHARVSCVTGGYGGRKAVQRMYMDDIIAVYCIVQRSGEVRRKAKQPRQHDPKISYLQMLRQSQWTIDWDLKATPSIYVRCIDSNFLAATGQFEAEFRHGFWWSTVTHG
jgi:hypothetical protein